MNYLDDRRGCQLYVNKKLIRLKLLVSDLRDMLLEHWHHASILFDLFVLYKNVHTNPDVCVYVYVSTVTSYWLIHSFLVYLSGTPADIVFQSLCHCQSRST
jgi:hypothetical protein